MLMFVLSRPSQVYWRTVVTVEIIDINVILTFLLQCLQIKKRSKPTTNKIFPSCDLVKHVLRYLKNCSVFNSIIVVLN